MEESIENVSNFNHINHKFNFWRITKRSYIKIQNNMKFKKKSSEQSEDFGMETDMP